MYKKLFVLTLVMLLAVGSVVAVGDFVIQYPTGTNLFNVSSIGNVWISGNLTVGDLASCDSIDTDANGFLTCGSDDGLSQEEVEDYIGAMVSGNTESNITVTYQDGDGTIDFVVSGFYGSLADLQAAVSNDFHNLGGTDDDDPEAGDVTWGDLTDEGTFTDGQMCTYASGTGYISCNTAVPSDTTLTQEEVEDYAGAMWSGNTESLITIEYQDGDGTIDASLDTASPSDGDTTHVSTADQIYDWGVATFLANVVEDTTPQLGGDLDLNSNAIVGGGSTNASIDATGNFVIVLG